MGTCAKLMFRWPLVNNLWLLLEPGSPPSAGWGNVLIGPSGKLFYRLGLCGEKLMLRLDPAPPPSQWLAGSSLAQLSGSAPWPMP